MSADIKKDAIYNVLGVIYKALQKQKLITEPLVQRLVHADASAKSKEYLAQLTEEEKVIWYMIVIMYKEIFEQAGNYYKFKESDPKKFEFLNNKRPFYQSINRVDLTRAYIFEQAVQEIKVMNFQDLQEKTGVLLEPKNLGSMIRSEIVRKIKEM